MSDIDDDLLKQMELQEESPDDPRQRKVKKVVYAKSQYNVEDLKAKVGDRVWVKCITELGPWADEKQLRLWKDYNIKVEEAIMLDERRFAVILVTPEAAKQPATQQKPPQLKLNK